MRLTTARDHISRLNEEIGAKEQISFVFKQKANALRRLQAECQSSANLNNPLSMAPSLNTTGSHLVFASSPLLGLQKCAELEQRSEMTILKQVKKKWQWILEPKKDPLTVLAEKQKSIISSSNAAGEANGWPRQHINPYTSRSRAQAAVVPNLDAGFLRKTPRRLAKQHETHRFPKTRKTEGRQSTSPHRTTATRPKIWST